MKYLIALLFPLLLAAADLESVEKLFAQGKFDECGKAIDKLLAGSGLEKKESERLLAMREYLLGNDAERIAETVKQAQTVASHQEWLNADLLNHATLLIRRAEDWKSRGIPEYQQLSDSAAKLLERVRDGGDAGVALRHLMLLTRNCNLNGEFQLPLRRINQTLQLYYPETQKQSGKVQPGAIPLLILAGEQCFGSGARNNAAQSKISEFTLAAKFYLRALDSLPATDPRCRDLEQRLNLCRETLRLLGFQLRLPSRIKADDSPATAIIDEMFRSRRYYDAALALEQNPAPEMRLRYALALAACGQFEKAAEVAGTADIPEKEPELFLATARFLLAGGRKKEALPLLLRFLKLAPGSPDSLSAVRECSGILVEAGEYEEASRLLLSLAETAGDDANQIRFLAAQCFYQAGKNKECIRLASSLPVSRKQALLLAQARMRENDYSGALKDLEPLLEQQAERREILKLLVRCASVEDQAKAIVYAGQLLREYPHDAEQFEYAKLLLAMHPPAKELDALGEWLYSNHKDGEKTIALALECASRLPEEKREILLRKFLIRKECTPAELLQILRHDSVSVPVKKEFISRFPAKFENTPELCALYLQMAELEYSLRSLDNALACCALLLKQSEVFEYRKVKLLQIRLLTEKASYAEAAEGCRELLLAQSSPSEKREVVLLLAQIHERGGDAKKAIAIAWSGIPLSGKTEHREQLPRIRELLDLIVRNAEKIDSREDRDEAEALLALFQ